MSKNIKRIFIASDHAGYELKNTVFTSLKEKNLEIIDLGADSSSKSVDYPDFANKLTSELLEDKSAIGILICGSGIGISIAANRKKHIRAALCVNENMAKLSRQHNDANVLCLGARLISETDALNIVDEFLKTEFAGDRHIKRVEKLSS